MFLVKDIEEVKRGIKFVREENVGKIKELNEELEAKLKKLEVEKRGCETTELMLKEMKRFIEEEKMRRLKAEMPEVIAEPVAVEEVKEEKKKPKKGKKGKGKGKGKKQVI